jgi:glycine/D-amino acid oxidase-like deaminating enzyme
MNQKTFDFIVVGNGAIGSASAIRLAKEFPDANIAVIGPQRRPGSASVAAGFMFNVFGELEKGLLEKPLSKEKFKLSMRSKDLWARWLETLSTLSNKDLKANMGTIIFSNSAASDIDDENFDYIVNALEEYKEPYELISAKDVKGFKPAQQSRAMRLVRIPNEGSIESAKLFNIFDSCFKNLNNLSVISECVKSISVTANDKICHLASGETVSSKKLILAAGAFTQYLIDSTPDLNKKIPPIFYGTGAALHCSINTDIPGFEFDLPDHVIRSTNRGNACGIHVVPYDNNHCYVGASNMVTRYFEPNARMAALHGLLDSALNEININFYKANSQVIVGHRPTSADTYPIIGPVESVDGLYILSGTKREGVHLSPLLSQALVDHIATGQWNLPKEFLPERKLISELKKEDAIETTIAHHLSGAYQHGLRMPHTGWEPTIVDALRKNIISVYDKLGIDFGIAPEMLNMYKHGHIKEHHWS